MGKLADTSFVSANFVFKCYDSLDYVIKLRHYTF